MGLTRILIPVLDCLLAISKSHDAGKRLSNALRKQRELREMDKIDRILREACEESSDIKKE